MLAKGSIKSRLGVEPAVECEAQQRVALVLAATDALNKGLTAAPINEVVEVESVVSVDHSTQYTWVGANPAGEVGELEVRFEVVVMGSEAGLQLRDPRVGGGGRLGT